MRQFAEEIAGKIKGGFNVDISHCKSPLSQII